MAFSVSTSVAASMGYSWAASKQCVRSLQRGMENSATLWSSIENTTAGHPKQTRRRATLPPPNTLDAPRIGIGSKLESDPEDISSKTEDKLPPPNTVAHRV